MKIKFSFLILILLCFIFVSSQNKNVVGYYSSIFPIQGSFIENISLYNNGTFKYKSEGHMFSDEASGTYKKNKKKVFLEYTLEPIDTMPYTIDTMPYTIDSLGRKYYSRRISDIARSQINFDIRPKILHISNNKLFITRANGENHKKKYFNIILKKKYYFKKYKSPPTSFLTIQPPIAP